MKINQIENVHLTDGTRVRLKQCGNLFEIRWIKVKPQPSIKKLDRNHYLDLLTGEIKEIRHHTNRASDLASVSQSMGKLRDIINTNITNPENALWVTLTYRYNMTDANQLYEDYRRFWQRFQYYLKNHMNTHAEYIVAAEPQGRGAWHLHALFLFPEKAPFIANQVMARIWKHGFTKTKSLIGVDNPGLYLTAYLGDMEITEAITAGRIKEGRLTQAKNSRKAILKGARLGLYPSGMNLYRCSRGIKKPVIDEMTEKEVQEILKDTPLIYEKTISIEDDTGVVKNIINYRHYKMTEKSCLKSPTE